MCKGFRVDLIHGLQFPNSELVTMEPSPTNDVIPPAIIVKEVDCNSSLKLDDTTLEYDIV